ncbi:hypothetical protein GCM10010302_28390 [Streptomyces polychromogenes]|uniref:Uncharacterized protein n=1 Tax=Streptomyces polychromogenes TaxID=67342 RepID=A0ABP3F0P4_9ACTN
MQLRCGAGTAGELTGVLGELNPRRIALVTDPGLPRAHAAHVLRLLGAAAPTAVLWPQLPTGGGAGLPAVPDDALVVAFGGSRVMAAAGRALRADGTRPPLVRLPTTLRAMSDSALSVADGTGGPGAAPLLVRIQAEFLDTLPPRALRAGLSPLLRTVLAVVPGSAARVAARLRPGGGYGPEVLLSFVSLCVEARSALCLHDPLERGPAAAFRYGEGVARAVAGLSPGIPYGEALAAGLRASAAVARALGLLSAADEAAHEDLLARAGAARTLPGGIEPGRVAAAVTGGGRSAPMVLLRGPGEPYAHGGGLFTEVGADLLHEALAALAPARRVPGPDRDRERIAAPRGRDGGRTRLGGASASRADGASAPLADGTSTPLADRASAPFPRL